MEELPPLSDEYLAGRPQKRRRVGYATSGASSPVLFIMMN